MEWTLPKVFKTVALNTRLFYFGLIFKDYLHHLLVWFIHPQYCGLTGGSALPEVPAGQLPREERDSVRDTSGAGEGTDWQFCRARQADEEQAE